MDVLAEKVLTPSMSFALTAIVSMLIVLGIMVLVHEFGHFIVAKLFGVRVEVFSIGFGKRLCGFRRGDTDYRLCLLPFGGYVKMTGENPAEATSGDPGEFTAHPRWQRVLIGLAGPVANFILAFVLMTGFYMMHNEVFDYLSGSATIDFVPSNSPAGRAGLRNGDLITRFDTQENPNWEQVRIRAALNLNQSVPVTVLRNGQSVSTELDIIDTSKGEDFSVEKLGLLPRVQSTPLQVRTIESGMPAGPAGMRSGDRIVSVNGLEFHSVPSVLAFLQENQGKPVQINVQRGSQILPLTVKPAEFEGGDSGKLYRIGFEPLPPPFHVEQMPLPEAALHSISFSAHNSGLIMDVLRRVITHRMAVETLSGPVGIARQTGLAVQMPGWQPIIELMSIISLNLGIFNLLPIPILDGGLILLLTIEGLIRRDINQEFKERIYQVAFVVLVLFAVFVMFNDVAKLPIFSKLKP
jgi:regulator of sigma E protease